MDVSEANFEADVVERSHDVPVVADFWADWCGPCHALSPVLEGAVAERAGAVELAKIDIEASPELARRYSVSGIPAVKAFRDGQVVSEFVGARSPASVAAFLDELLAPPRADTLLEQLRATGELPELQAALDRGDTEGALELILASVPDASPEERERLREIAIALFQRLGHENPVTVDYRRRLATALF